MPVSENGRLVGKKDTSSAILKLFLYGIDYVFMEGVVQET